MPSIRQAFLLVLIALSSLCCAPPTSLAQDLPADFHQELRAYERRWATQFWHHYHTGEQVPPAPFPYAEFLPDGWRPCRDEYRIFESIYAHRLRLNPSVGQYSYLLDDLLRDDPAVRDAFELFTCTGILATPLSDAIASTTHLAIALSDGAVYTPTPDPDECWEYSRADISMTGDYLLSEGDFVRSLCGGGQEPQPVQPLTCDDVPLSICVGGAAVILRWTDSNLWLMPYSDDEWFYGWNTIGFDCDDYADALAAYLKNKQDAGMLPADMKIDALYLWYPSEGWFSGKDGHVVLLITIGDYYFIAEAQSAPPTLHGPFPKNTPLKDIDWSPISEGINKTTKPYQIDVRKPTDRPWNDPAPWHESPQKRQQIQEKTGHPPHEFIHD